MLLMVITIRLFLTQITDLIMPRLMGSPINSALTGDQTGNHQTNMAA